MTITGDNPIRRPEDDALGRAAVAESFAQQVLGLDVTEGVVVGVLGAWGSGKTSFVNLARIEFERAGVPILDFNPWMFSGAEQLVESFFVELSAQLKIRPDLAEVGKMLETYGEAFSGMVWLPLLGPWLARGRGAAKVVGRILRRGNGGAAERRAKLRKTLADLDKPILIILDDIDRLSTSEIRDVFKLVRLTASFPNLIYVVAFDRVRIEGALSEQGVSGREYLEKILQVAVDVPAVPSQVLNNQISSALDGALAGIERPGPFDKKVWPDVLMEIIHPLIRNMRDVRRYAAAVHLTVGSLDDHVALADVLALEAIRVFLPDVFSCLHTACESLTSTSDVAYAGVKDPPQFKAQIDNLLEAAETHTDVVRAMIKRLFPAGDRHIGGSHYGPEWRTGWLRARRVAHEDILRLYLERVAGEGLEAFKDAAEAWACMDDPDVLDTFLRSLDGARLEGVIGSLETYEDEFAPKHVVPGTVVLLNILPDLPERQRGVFELATSQIVTRVAYRLLRSLKDPAALEAAVRQILPELNSLSSKTELLDIVGYRENIGHELVSRAAAAEFERAWRNEVRSASADDLATERDLARVLILTKREADPSEGSLSVEGSPKLTLALLRSSRSEAISQPMDSRAVHRSPRLAWELLVEVVGDEASLREWIESLKETGLEGADDLLQLADKYLGGWRPSDLSEE